VVTEAAVKQHLSNLYSKFRLAGDGERRRVRLANEAIRRGAVAHPSEPPVPPSAPGADELERGRDAHAHRDWPRARELLAQADAHQPLGPDDLERLAEAAFVTGEYEDSLRARERRYAAALDVGDVEAAAMSALRLCSALYLNGELAVAAGWQSTAERLLADEPESRAHGLLHWVQGRVALLLERDMEGALTHARALRELGECFGDVDLQILGLSGQGRAYAGAGDAARATALLGEAMASAVSGGLRPWTACIVFCDTLSTCLDLGDYRRAGEWADAVKGCCARESIVPASGECRVHRAGVLKWQGAWDEAIDEATAGIAQLRRDVLHGGIARYEIGEIHLRQGDLRAAEEAFERADEMARSPQPGLALVRLAQGKPEVARSMVDQALAETHLDPARLGLSAARCEIALATGDLTTARDATDEILRIASAYGTPGMEAIAAASAGALALAEGDTEAALVSLRRGWQRRARHAACDRRRVSAPSSSRGRLAGPGARRQECLTPR
jgi:tetratricopeptide (TPR) repeat protein